jgi:ATP-dependent RNA helicase HrpB
MDPLPIDPYLDRIVDALERARAAVLVASPGAGKTTRVPPALLADGPVVVLQPRRVAARAIAARIAAERGWTLGREIGWQVRFERRFTRDTRLLVVTEGILTARLQQDPLLSDFRTIVLDEFHERSIHADLALALARQAWRARDDLRIVVMSATLDAAPVAAFLDGCPVIDVPGRLHSVDVSHAPGQPVADAVADVLGATRGSVLCFLPGAAEIRRGIADIEARVARAAGLEVLPLHGSLPPDDQERAVRESPVRRVIVATNIAETSLTIPDVTAVVDSGLQKVARYDADRAVDTLSTERITADSAAQRAGRAGRIAPGVARRLWDARDRLRPHREPEIHRVDVSPAALDVIAWGGDPRQLEWFDPPRREALDAALTLLERLGLVDRGRLTAIGESVRRLPLHPRLARLLVAADGARQAARACAILSEGRRLPPRTSSTSSDLLSAVDDWHHVADFGLRTAESAILSRYQSAISNSQSAIRNQQSEISESVFLQAVFAAYPDRVAQRRQPASASVLMASGVGAMIAPASGVRDGEFLVAVDLRRGEQSPAGRRAAAVPTIFMASRVDRDWLRPTASETVHRFDAQARRVKAFRVDRYDALIVAERPAAVDDDVASAMLAQAWMERGPSGEDRRLIRRLRFIGHEVDLAALVRAAAARTKALDDVDIAAALPHDIRRRLDRDAPETLPLPSGRSTRLDYEDDGVSASAKLQELFGLGDTPCIGPRRVPVRLALLAPNGRPVQVTQDLRSFWNRTYPEVRRELRGRYPKHPWPEDPWSATPTVRTKRRSG